MCEVITKTEGILWISNDDLQVLQRMGRKFVWSGVSHIEV